MSAPNVRVTVAPLQHVVIPHPSGLPQLAPQTLFAGQKLTVTAARADELYRAGRILHPVTGQPKPYRAPSEPQTVTRMGTESWASLAARADAERAEKPAQRPRPLYLDPFNGRRQFEPRDPQTTSQDLDFSRDHFVSGDD